MKWIPMMITLVGALALMERSDRRKTRVVTLRLHRSELGRLQDDRPPLPEHLKHYARPEPSRFLQKYEYHCPRCRKNNTCLEGFWHYRRLPCGSTLAKCKKCGQFLKI